MPMLLIRILTWFSASLVARMLTGAGLAFMNMQFISTIFSMIESEVKMYASGASYNVLVAMHLFEIDFLISVMLSAFYVRTLLMGAQIFLTKATS